MLYVLLPLQREIILVSINFLQVCVTSTFRVHKSLIKYQVSISTVAAICVIYYFYFSRGLAFYHLTEGCCNLECKL
jgi:hypothetical protein